jgi:hypothetical protein
VIGDDALTEEITTMKLLLLCMTIALLSHREGLTVEREDDSKNGSRPTLAIADLNPKMVGKHVTVRFTVAKLGGIAERHVPGQAPSFAIETKSEHRTKKLSVWVMGELANVLDRLQMSYLQTNQFKKGTIIVVTGKLGIHQNKKDGELYSLEIKKWQKFRIVPPSKAK